MSLEIWLLFVASELFLCLTPGPAVLLVVSQGMRHGFGASAAVRSLLLGSAAVRRWFQRSLGALLVAFAARLALTER